MSIDKELVITRYRELCAGDPNEVINALLELLAKEDGTFPWHAVYMHKLELEQTGRAPYAMGFEKFMRWMVSKPSQEFARLATEEPQLEQEAERLIAVQEESSLTEEELYEFVSRFNTEELSYTGF